MEKLLFWAVVVWMIGMLVLGFIAVREIWRDAEKDETDELKGESVGGSAEGLSTDGGKSQAESAATDQSGV